MQPRIHWQTNPGGTFPVTACGLVGVGKPKLDVRPDEAFYTSPEKLRCKTCANAWRTA